MYRVELLLWPKFPVRFALPVAGRGGGLRVFAAVKSPTVCEMLNPVIILVVGFDLFPTILFLFLVFPVFCPPSLLDIGQLRLPRLVFIIIPLQVESHDPCSTRIEPSIVTLDDPFLNVKASRHVPFQTFVVRFVDMGGDGSNVVMSHQCRDTT